MSGGGRAVYLNHPQGEPPIRRFQGDECDWNTDKGHTRKFLRAPARLVDWAGGRPVAHRGWSDVGFWGEWEAPSHSGRYARTTDPFLPQRWHVPALREEQAPAGAHATDPWVFGPTMLYYVCQQRRSRMLRDLERGDVVFFGSVKRSDGVPRDVRRAGHSWGFMLDTVFVVGAAHPYRDLADLKRLLPASAAIDQCIRPCVDEGCRGMTLYEGRMFSETRGADPFCWVPARRTDRHDPEADRFARPFISHVLREGGPDRRTPATTLRVAASAAWNMVTEHCAAAGIEIATELRLPTGGRA